MRFNQNVVFSYGQIKNEAPACRSRLDAGRGKPAWRDNPVLVFGQTVLFFYLLHIPLLFFSSHLLGVRMELGLAATYLATAGVLIVLYPCCRWYCSIKPPIPAAGHVTSKKIGI